MLASALTSHSSQAGYSVQNVVFGMGGGLLQRVDRDTMSFATKLSYIARPDGTSMDVMKKPKTDSGKISLPGKLCGLAS
jgi:nicotinic acid phosphoribosyltransferase